MRDTRTQRNISGGNEQIGKGNNSLHFLSFFVCFCLLLVGCRESKPLTPKTVRIKGNRIIHDYRGYLKELPRMRVVIINKSASVKIAINGPYFILTENSQRTNGGVLDSGQKLAGTRVSATKTGLRLGRRSITANEIQIVPSRDGSLKVAGSPYRGELRVLRNPNQTVTVLNIVDVEKYLWGVLGSEMPLSWPDAALEAQSVAARTYALYQKLSSKNRYYDVMATTANQAYRGMLDEKGRDNRCSRDIVNRTRGVVMRYNSRFIEAYYHNTCGGHTEDVSRVFNTKSIIPLSGLPCEYCRKSPYLNWQIKLGRREIERKLRRVYRGIGKIDSILCIEIDSSGRPAKIVVKHSSGTTSIDTPKFRRLIGYSNLRSTKFTVRKSGDLFIFTGHGYGHGIGLCQYGAKGMAEDGNDYLTILAYYYPDVEFARIY